MNTDDQLYQDRLKRREILAEFSHAGQGSLDHYYGTDTQVGPYGGKFPDVTPIATIRNKHTPDAPTDVTYRAAGRVVSKHDCGKLVFFHLSDSSDIIQIWASKADLWDGFTSYVIGTTTYPMPWYLVQNLQPGDIVGVEGYLTTTKTGEISLRINKISMLCKSLATPPDRFHGITDPEIFSRHRHLEMIYRDGLVKTLQQRSQMVWKIRQLLAEEGFTEVETPVLQPIAGGAAARPFVTHHNAYGGDLYLRIAPELYLKRLLVGGMERIYEIGKNFRNEGIDKTHNPEFSMLELYQAYSDAKGMEEITRKIAAALGLTALAEAKITTYNKLLKEHCGIAFYEYTQTWPDFGPDILVQGDPIGSWQLNPQLVPVLAALTKLPDTTSVENLLDHAFDKFVLPNVKGAVFIYDYPTVLCPLARPSVIYDGHTCERWELFVDGMEIANAYTELTNPDVQLANFEKQIGVQPGQYDDRIDYDFIDALVVGMPPAGGLGIGIDRLAMLYTNNDSIRDVIAFPHTRPK